MFCPKFTKTRCKSDGLFTFRNTPVSAFPVLECWTHHLNCTLGMNKQKEGLDKANHFWWKIKHWKKQTWGECNKKSSLRWLQVLPTIPSSHPAGQYPVASSQATPPSQKQYMRQFGPNAASSQAASKKNGLTLVFCKESKEQSSKAEMTLHLNPHRRLLASQNARKSEAWDLYNNPLKRKHISYICRSRLCLSRKIPNQHRKCRIHTLQQRCTSFLANNSRSSRI